MSQREIIKKIKEWPKFNGNYKKEFSIKDFISLKKYPTKTILLKDPFPIANKAFPTKFNLSVAEYVGMKICKKRGYIIGNLFDYTKLPYHSFWTITLNSRESDMEEIKKGSDKHLLLFHIAGVGGFSIVSPKIEYRIFYIKNFIEFLEEYIDISMLEVTFFNGGEICQHGIKKEFIADWNKEVFSSLAEEKRFKLTPTKNSTFLSLQVFGSPIHWGYRNEFHLKYNNSLIDIGTIEFLPYVPQFEKARGKVIYKKIISAKNAFIGSAVGLERIQMLYEGVKKIWEISNIKPLMDWVRKNSNKNGDDKSFFIVEELLRFFHQIYSEMGGITSGELRNKHRREIVSKYLNILIAGIIYLKIEPEKIKEFFELNSKLQVIEGDILKKDLEENFKKFFSALSEQLRFYKTSSKYKPKIDKLIEDYYSCRQ